MKTLALLLSALFLVACASQGPKVPETTTSSSTVISSEALPSPTPSVSANIPAGTQKARVSRNVDDDTIWAEPIEAGAVALGAAHRIRILEIDTPEIYGRTVECYGPEPSAFAKQELPVGSTINLLADKEDKDRFQRFLRYVWQEDGDFYNDMAVRQGSARAVLYMPNDLYINQLRQAEAEAQGEQPRTLGGMLT